MIGDKVRVVHAEKRAWVIEEVLPRRSTFSRRQPGPGGKHREDILVANIDTLVVVFAYERPELQPFLIDRFLVAAASCDIDVLMVANKSDLMNAEDRAVFDGYAKLGYPLISLSAKYGDRMQELRAAQAGKICAFVGPSGVGKSSLVNELCPCVKLDVGEVNEAIGKGCHTTRAATLHPFDGGGYLADTPGIRELGTWQMPCEKLAACFIEFDRVASECRFRGCQHRAEPDCAIKDAVENGAVSRARYENYLRLYQEILDESVR